MTLNTDIHTPPTREELLENLAALCKDTIRSDAEMARIIYTLRSYNVTPSQVVREMHARHAHSISTSWVVRLAKIYEWWVVRHKYDAREVFRYSKNKLYMMALHGIGDWDFLVAHGELSDREFMLLLRKETNTEPETYIVNIPASVKQALVELAQRLSTLTGSQVGIIPTLEISVEIARSMSDETLLTLWNAAHGETETPSLYKEESTSLYAKAQA